MYISNTSEKFNINHKLNYHLPTSCLLHQKFFCVCGEICLRRICRWRARVPLPFFVRRIFVFHFLVCIFSSTNFRLAIFRHVFLFIHAKFCLALFSTYLLSMLFRRYFFRPVIFLSIYFTSNTPYLAIDERAPGKEASICLSTLGISMHYAVKYCIYKLWTMCLFGQ